MLPRLAAWLRKLGWLMTRRTREADLREELEFHLAREADDRRKAGLSDDEARAAARRDLGNLALVVEDTRAAWGWIAVEQGVQDVRYAIRTLARSPTVAAAAIVTLSLGIGLTTSIFSVVHGVLLRPLPFTDPDRILTVQTILDTDGQTENGLSPPNATSLLEVESGSFESVAAAVENAVTLTGAGDPRRLRVPRLSGPFFEVLDAHPVLGRAFRADETEPGRDRVAILGHTIWKEQFGGDPAVLGRTILLDGVSYSVVGVMGPGFDFPNGAALWVPQATGRNYFSATSAAGRRNNAYIRVYGRLRPETTLEAAREELMSFGRTLEARFPDTNRDVTFSAIPLHEEIVGDARTPLLMLFGAVALVLSIACANVAGLLLARSASRRDEIAVRAALGAARGRIVRQLVTESLLLGVGGGLLGILLAFWLTDRIVAADIESLRGLGLADAIRIDGVVLLFAVGVTVFVGVVAGLLPALRAASDGMSSHLQAAGRGGAERGQRLRRGLVLGQLAIAVVLLEGAGLLVHSLVRLMTVDLGFTSERLLTFNIDLPGASYGRAELRERFFSEVDGRVRQRPGVLSAGSISRLPIRQRGSFRSRFQVEGRSGEERSIGVRIVSEDYFQTIGVPIVRGRGISSSDRAGSLPVVLVNQVAAGWLFPGENPIGRRLVRFSYDPIEQAAAEFTIVGVVADIRSRGLADRPQAEAYFAHPQVPIGNMFVVVRTAGDPVGSVAAIREDIKALDPNLPMPAFQTFDQVVADSLGRLRFFTTLLSLFSGVALALAAVGIFGLLSFSVARCTHEIGVRMALGATSPAVVRGIVRESFVLLVLGLGIGLVGSFGLTRLMQSELYEVSPTDPVTFTGVAVTLGVVSLLASVVPAWRAATIDPLAALRAE